MVIGPAIGNFVIEKFADGTYTNDYGEIVNVPVPAIFLASAIVSVVILIPVIALRKTWQAKADELKQANK